MAAREHLSLVRFSGVPSVDPDMLTHLQGMHAIPTEQIRAEMDQADLGQDDYHTLLHEADEGYGAEWRRGARPHDLNER